MTLKAIIGEYGPDIAVKINWRSSLDTENYGRREGDNKTGKPQHRDNAAWERGPFIMAQRPYRQDVCGSDGTNRASPRSGNGHARLRGVP
jgi:hypothetical protein